MTKSSLFKKAGNSLASKELEFVSRFWVSEEVQMEYSKSFYFGIEESEIITSMIGNNYDYYVKYRNNNLRRIDNFVSIVNRYVKGKSRILDIGCGLGQIGYRLQNCGHDVLGIDNNLQNISMGKIILSQLGSSMTLYHGDALQNDLPSHAYDVILCCDVIEHIPEQKKLLSNIMRMLRPDGIAFIGTDNKRRIQLGVFGRRILCMASLKNPFAWKHAWADMDGGHCALISENELLGKASSVGFHHCKIKYYGDIGMIHLCARILSPKFVFIGKK
jgi:2-polyprenyl-3-methyl-5-hydroxy-6-metoxy-1,4-benzoquinol methylase